MTAPVELHLYFLEGPRAGERLVFTKRKINLGRDSSCDVIFSEENNRGVSRRHAQLKWTDGEWRLYDYSTNGTIIGSDTLHNSDRIIMGIENIRLSDTGEKVRIQIPFMPELEEEPEPVLIQDSPSSTKIIPLASEGFFQQFLSQPFIIPGIATVVAGLAMFAFLQSAIETGSINYVYAYEFVLGVYLGSMLILAVKQMSGSSAPAWIPFSATLFTGFLLVLPWSIYLFSLLFRPPTVIAMIQSQFFLSKFLGHFIGAGLMEELMKSIPVWIALLMAGRFHRLNIPGFEKGRLHPPLAILIGASSAAGFILVETLLMYVPEIQQGGNPAAGLMLLIPRFITGICGHAAWSGLFAYFIGLSHIYRKKRVLMVFIGWLSASLLHGLWNATADISQFGAVIAVASFVIFTAYLYKARESFPEIT
ncbi:MAG: PrsW family glutamic-type intramembrane protease [Candidatus Marinimicrobia bacterium]|nr:PrsW family glutamic-type intramembrane protease [Candidatus Neomarinimicrobiota bacterium]